jgi:hypothetical protein
MLDWLLGRKGLAMETPDYEAEVVNEPLEIVTPPVVDPQWTRPQVCPPTPADIEAMKQFYVGQRLELLRQVSEIESMLGFIAGSADLAVRVARLEQFLGIKTG